MEKKVSPDKSILEKDKYGKFYGGDLKMHCHFLSFLSKSVMLHQV